MIRLKVFLAEITSASVSAGGAITAYQVQLDYWLRQVAAFTAIVASILTVVIVIKNWKPNAKTVQSP